MNSKIISEWINNKDKVAVILNYKDFNGFNNTAYIHTAGIIKENDSIRILYKTKEKIFYIPYISVIEIEPLNINKRD